MLRTLLCADIPVARANTEMLSDQTLCELFISALDDNAQHLHKDSEGEFLDIEKFPFVLMSKSGEPHEIRILYNGAHYYTGSFLTEYIPRTVRIVCAFGTHIEGTLDFSAFPPNLREMIFQNNLISGSAALEELPASTRKIDIPANRFTGTIAFGKLPPRLERLNVGNNGFQGTVALRDIPQTLIFLDLSINRLTGNLGDIPQSLDDLKIFTNDFSGTLDLRSVRDGVIIEAKPPIGVFYARNPLVDKRTYCNRRLTVWRKTEEK